MKASKRLNVRVTQAEHAAIAAKADKADMTISEFVRKRALRDPQGSRPIEVDTAELKRLYRDLRHAGGNLNQVCKWLNSHATHSNAHKHDLHNALSATARASEQVASFISEARERA